MPKQEIGTIKAFNDSKGYDFIERQSVEDCFVHFSAINADEFRKLVEGQRVGSKIEPCTEPVDLSI